MSITRYIRRLATGTALAVLVALLPLQASAHDQGQHWPYTPHTFLTLKYGNQAYLLGAADDASHSWRDIVSYSADAFTATPTAIVLAHGCDWFCYKDNNINVWQSSPGNPSALASTTWYFTGTTITYADVFLNADRDAAGNFISFGALNVFGQEAAVLHEFGHTLGLAHAGCYAGEKNPDGTCVAPYSVMDYCCYFNVLQPHDINDLNAYYPYP